MTQNLVASARMAEQLILQSKSNNIAQNVSEDGFVFRAPEQLVVTTRGHCTMILEHSLLACKMRILGLGPDGSGSRLRVHS